VPGAGGWLGQVSVIDLLPHLPRDERESRRHVWHDALGLLQARQAALAAPCVLGHRTNLLAMRLESSGKEWAVSTSPTCEIDPMVVVAGCHGGSWRLAHVAAGGAHAHGWPLRVPARLAPGSRVLVGAGPRLSGSAPAHC
jgi:hypothetical protein